MRDVISCVILLFDIVYNRIFYNRKGKKNTAFCSNIIFMFNVEMKCLGLQENCRSCFFSTCRYCWINLTIVCSNFFCRDISCYNSFVFKALKLNLDICNLLKKCMLNIKNHWNRTILKDTFFFAPIKWATSGLVRSAQNWFQSKQYVVKIIR